MVQIHHSPPSKQLAGVAQLVECQPSKLDVARSNRVARSIFCLALHVRRAFGLFFYGETSWVDAYVAQW
jgi:hypothetical protein